MISTPCLRAAVVVAHPDDETLWCGGFILAHPEFHWRIVTLCRASDPDRAPRFRQVVERFGGVGAMADLDDGAELHSLPRELVEQTVMRLLEEGEYAMILTHGPNGEYTSHRRHEECSQAVVGLWSSGRIWAGQLWLFAYEDGARNYLPRVRSDADRREVLTDAVWHQKHHMITGLYGFALDSWEARTTPREEGFWCFDTPQVAADRLQLEKEL